MNNNFLEWTDGLVKPFFYPENWVFPFAWGIIYPILFSCFFYFLYLYFFKNKYNKKIFYIFILNLFTNASFILISFLENNILASLDILVVLSTLVYLEYYFFTEKSKESKIIFFFLMPYLLWGSYATILMLTVTYLNF